jgi:hypothetical protein
MRGEVRGRREFWRVRDSRTLACFYGDLLAKL